MSSEVGSNEILLQSYFAPKSRMVRIRVAASEPMNVYLLDEYNHDLIVKARDKNWSAFQRSDVLKFHEFDAKNLPNKFYVAMENPWKMSIDVIYTVLELEERRSWW
jgi:hypothetical protein